MHGRFLTIPICVAIIYLLLIKQWVLIPFKFKKVLGNCTSVGGCYPALTIKTTCVQQICSFPWLEIHSIVIGNHWKVLKFKVSLSPVLFQVSNFYSLSSLFGYYIEVSYDVVPSDPIFYLFWLFFFYWDYMRLHGLLDLNLYT